MNNQNEVTVQTHWGIKVVALISILTGGLFLYTGILNSSSNITDF